MTASTQRQLHGVYGVTDDRLLDETTLMPRVEAALEGGISVLQYRNKSGSAEACQRQAAELKALCRDYGVPLLINDDVELCHRIGADGVHLGRSDMDLQAARDYLGPEAIIGATCHGDPANAVAAQQAGASYAAMGRFFPSRTKPGAPGATIDDLRRARQQLRIPLAAIGGVTPANGGKLIEAGADMLAVIHYLFAGPDTRARARALAALFRPPEAAPRFL